MAQTSYVFKRVEKKFLIEEETLCAFLAYISPYVKRDTFGQYTICNIYYDTFDNQLINKSIEKPIYKEKLRLRSYGIANEASKVFVEIKKKYDGTVFKRRISLSLQEATEYLSGKNRPKKESQILHEIDYFMEQYHPIPKLFIAYDRLAYAAIYEPNVRITIDSNIRSRNKNLNLSLGDMGELLLKENQHLIEIKTDSSFPMWLSAALAKFQIYPVSFSKYGNIYKKNMQRATLNEYYTPIHTTLYQEAI